MPRCKGRTLKHTQCRLLGKDGSRFCRHHLDQDGIETPECAICLEDLEAREDVAICVVDSKPHTHDGFHLSCTKHQLLTGRGRTLYCPYYQVPVHYFGYADDPSVPIVSPSLESMLCSMFDVGRYGYNTCLSLLNALSVSKFHMTKEEANRENTASLDSGEVLVACQGFAAEHPVTFMRLFELLNSTAHGATIPEKSIRSILNGHLQPIAGPA